MTILGIDEITYGVEDVAASVQFFKDWGLTLIDENAQQATFETLNGCRVVVADKSLASLPPAIEQGSTVREVVWGVETEQQFAHYAKQLASAPQFVKTAHRVGCTDPNGLAVKVQVTKKRPIKVECYEANTWEKKGRVNKPSPIYERAIPIEVGHVVFFVGNIAESEQFYRDYFGFVASDRYPNRGTFLRCSEEAGHHNLFLLEPPKPRIGLNHVAFTVRDIHEVIGGGMHVSRCGWSTELGPGRHPVSSAFFWYFNNPAGALAEYYTDEDHLTAEWQPREFQPGPTVFAEWAIAGGIDGNTRRQKEATAPSGQFLTDKPKQ